MKDLVKIPPVVAGLIAECQRSMMAAREYARSVQIDPNTPYPVKQDFLQIAASLSNPIERIDRRIPKIKQDEYNEQIKNNDPIRLENIIQIYHRMPVEKQEALENFTEQLFKGKIQIQGE